jgi:DNA-binding transcriptional LysR family regulator
MPLNFDMDALRSMVVGVELGSFARAAERLGRSQSAISMQLKKLEQQAGCPLFQRNGRTLMATEAGDRLLSYGRQILALNDEIAATLGSSANVATVRLGLPQDFFEDFLSEVLREFRKIRKNVHVEVRAGRNYALEDEVQAGRLDLALAFFEHKSARRGQHLLSLPMLWLAALDELPDGEPLPLVLYDHPCLFRQAALRALEAKGTSWRLSLTTPSLPGIWAALRANHGISVRTSHRIPKGVREVGTEFDLPRLPLIELRLLAAETLSPAARDLSNVLNAILRSGGETCVASRRQKAKLGMR